MLMNMTLPLGQWVDLEYMTFTSVAVLFLLLSGFIVILGMRSLAGLGPVRRWVAVGVRLALLLVLVLLLGGLQIRQQKHDLEVMVLEDISQSTTLYHRENMRSLPEAVGQYLKDASSSKSDKKPNDRIGLISFNDVALIDAMSNEYLSIPRALRAQDGTTDIAGAINLGLASFRRTTLHRLLLISDGNQTAGGDLDAAIAAAAAQHVPIDVMTLQYSVENDVMIDRVVSGKTWRRQNEPFTIDVFLRSTNTKPAGGTLTIFHNSAQGPVELEKRHVEVKAAGTGSDGRVEPSLDVVHVRIPELKSSGVHEFSAQFIPDDKSQDALSFNDQGGTFVIVQGKGKVLFVDNELGDSEKYIFKALAEGGIEVERVNIDGIPSSLVAMQAYDAIILRNVPRGDITEAQDRLLATYVHDLGGGIVMIGGPDTFGAGGWQGSKLESVLPINMDVPAQRQMPKGALVLVMHSCEMPNGNYWGEQCAIKAVEALSAQDEVGVISFGWNNNGNNGINGAQWDFPLKQKGSGAAVVAAIKHMQLGDMPDFEATLQLALNGTGPNAPCLANSNAARKHVIIISDGDPSGPSPLTIAAYQKAGVTVSTVPVYPHGGDPQGISSTMKSIADQTKGRAYPAISNNPNQLPQIFIKEAITIRRSLLQTSKDGFPVIKQTIPSDLVAGIDSFPPVFGYVLTTKKPTLGGSEVYVPLMVSTTDAEGKKTNDPLLAHWQAGLGRTVAFTSDAHNKWAAQWAGTPAFAKFWIQVVRSVQRPAMSSDFDVRVTRDGDKGKISVEALRKDSAFLNFLSIAGTVNSPGAKQEGTKQEIRLVQTGPGSYTAEFDARDPGNYVVALNYKGQKKDDAGWLMSGLTVNNSPELRDLRSNEAVMQEIARRTNGRVIEHPFDPDSAALFSRDNILSDSTPLPVRDILLPILIALLILDVAVRRIAWDLASIRRGMASASDYVRTWTLSKKVETGETLDALKRVREEVAQNQFKDAGAKTGPAPPPLPSAKAKFEAKGVEGDISQVLGGASDKPVPPPPKKIEPKGGPAAGGHTGSLLEAKRRAQQAIRQKEQGE